jgi:serine/threonine protein kinase/Tol biopolymer transport system component
MSMIGKTLAHYEINSQLGKGGMGEVYQAKDRKLGRDVAIKILPGEFARDTDRIARFQREAKLLASLNHPNIAAIYGLEEYSGTNFLVLELVEGQTLADQIKRGPIPVEESLKLALQIAEALEAAHEKGVIHRDLKPGNIKVTPESKVKVLDFGLAKAFAGEQADLNLSNSPTLSNAATQQGVILGTAAYMSPEQARGKTVDKRADIWAFGCVLYEMLAGRAAFSGKDVTDILAAVIRSEPEWNGLPANLHWRLREVLERCLKKDAMDRYHDISDVKADIQRVLSDPGGVLTQPVAALEPRTRLRTIPLWIAGVIVLSPIVAGVVFWKLKPPESHRIMRFDHNLPDDQQFNIDTAVFGHTLAVSPDGSQLVYSTGKGLYLRSVNELGARLIPGTEGNPQSPFFSPDGKWLGYWSQVDNKLKKIFMGGGAPVPLCDVTWVFGAIWYPDNTIVYSDLFKGIMRVSANGGAIEMLVKGRTACPQVLPDKKSVLFTDLSKTPYRTVVQSLKSGKRKELFIGGASHYLPTGHLVYGLQNGNSLMAIPFNLDTLEVESGPIPIVEGVREFYAVSDSGTLVYIPGAAAGETQAGRTLVWVDKKGKEEPIHAPANYYQNPNISPDGKRVTLTVTIDGNRDIYILDLASGNMLRITFDKGNGEAQSIWTPDGKRVVFSMVRGGGIYWKNADGTGEVETIISMPDMRFFPWSWSRDGKTLITQEADNALTKANIGTLSMEGDHIRKPLLKEEFTDIQPKISPDGKYMAYVSAEPAGIYVRPFPDVNKGKWQISGGGGISPLWSPDGRELFYLSKEGVMRAPVDTKTSFNAGKPEFLFKGPYVGPYVGSYGEDPSWDISPDGKRFLMIKQSSSTTPAATAFRKIYIVLNWFEELKQRVPVK